MELISEMNKIRKCPRCGKSAERTTDWLMCKKCTGIKWKRYRPGHTYLKRVWFLGSQEEENKITELPKHYDCIVQSRSSRREYRAKKLGKGMSQWMVTFPQERHKSNYFVHEDFIDLFEMQEAFILNSKNTP